MFRVIKGYLKWFYDHINYGGVQEGLIICSYKIKVVQNVMDGKVFALVIHLYKGDEYIKRFDVKNMKKNNINMVVENILSNIK